MGSFPQTRRINQMPYGGLMADDGRIGKGLCNLPDSACVIEVNMGQQDIVKLLDFQFL